jgi:hypothetical protein
MLPDWIKKALEDRRLSRQLAALARETGLAAPRLSRIALGYIEPKPEELAALERALQPPAAPTKSPVVPPPPPAARAMIPVAPAKVTAAPTKVPEAAPKPAASVPTSAGAIQRPMQGDESDFLFRRRLLGFLEELRSWPARNPKAPPGQLARLQGVWNEVQAVLREVNLRLYGTDVAPAQPKESQEPRVRRRRHHSFRYLVMEVCEERVPREAAGEIRDAAKNALAEGVSTSFLDSYYNAAEAILDEADFAIILEEAQRRRTAQGGPRGTQTTEPEGN